MDKALLVKNGKRLLALLVDAGIEIRAMVWVHSTDTDSWRLWIVPTTQMDKREFYRRVSAIISANRTELPSIDASDTELVKDSHPAIRGLQRIVHMDTVGADAVFEDCVFNNYHLPLCIVLRMTR